jgi:O-antigen ligase
MSFILITEYYTVGPFDGRLSWPYGDIMPGNFIAKTCMPILITAVAIYLSKMTIKNIYYLFIIMISTYAVILTGERTSALLTVSSCLLAFFVYRPSFKLLVSSLISLMIIISFIFYTDQTLFTRFSHQLIDNIPLLNTDTSYWGTWRSGLQQGLENFWFGVGPTGSRHTCGLLGPHWLPGENYCGNHPHNFYIQMFAETGFVGLLLCSTMIFFIIKVCWESKKYSQNCFFANNAFIIPLAMFFPFQQTGSFFGQWNNLFMWFALGLALSNFQKWHKD